MAMQIKLPIENALKASLYFDADEKIELAWEAFETGAYLESIYYAYYAFISAARVLLLEKRIYAFTVDGLLTEFDKTFQFHRPFSYEGLFANLVKQKERFEASQEFAKDYFLQSCKFVTEAISYREKEFNKINKQA